MAFLKRRLSEFFALGLASVIWLPSMHLFWRPRIAMGPATTDAIAVPMANSLENMWGSINSDHSAITPMRQVNPEWDFMGRTFFILGEANLALRRPDRKQRCLQAMDAILHDTIAMETEFGMEHFLLDYHRDNPWVETPPASIFVDGEIALCIGARRLIEEDPLWRQPFQMRIAGIVDRMERGPVLCAESYPNECWMFCNTIAMAALRMSEALDGADHSGLKTRW